MGKHFIQRQLTPGLGSCPSRMARSDVGSDKDEQLAPWRPHRNRIRVHRQGGAAAAPHHQRGDLMPSWSGAHVLGRHDEHSASEYAGGGLLVLCQFYRGEWQSTTKSAMRDIVQFL